MAPVEGEEYRGEKLVGKLNSTLPGDTQIFADFSPTILEISCDPDDNFGTLEIEGQILNITVSRLTKTKEKHPVRNFVKDLKQPLNFSGNERVFVRHQEDHSTKEIVLRHKKGKPR